jgi:hypothetical protein
MPVNRHCLPEDAIRRVQIKIFGPTRGSGAASKLAMQSKAETRTPIRLAGLAVLAVSFTSFGLGQTPSAGASSVLSATKDSSSADREKVAPSELADPSTEGTNVDPASLLPDLPSITKGNATLIGGTISQLDRIRDRMSLTVFGGGKVTALFDPRTKVYVGTNEGTIADLKQGDRVYLETVLDGSSVFARAIRVKGSPSLVQSGGTVLSSDHNELTLRDKISPEPIRIRWDAATKFMENGHTVDGREVVPGSLISVVFSPQNDLPGVAREISLLAVPGSKFTFVGEVTHVDLRSGLVVLNSSTDNKTYEIYLDPSVVPDENLHAGAIVTVLANFEGSKYVARNLTVDHDSK